jgi:hypothetical protein
MNRVLRANFGHERNLYWFIDCCLDVHLGVADKSDLLRHLSQNDHVCFDDLWKDTCDYLWGMGYKSEKLKEGINERKRNEEYWAHILSPHN